MLWKSVAPGRARVECWFELQLSTHSMRRRGAPRIKSLVCNWHKAVASHRMRRRGAERIKSFGCNWHKAIARSSWLASGYLVAVSAISRNVLGLRLAERIGSLVTANSIEWPEMAFLPRSVV